MTRALINGSKVICLCITFNLFSFYSFPFCSFWSKHFMCTTCTLRPNHRQWKRNASPCHIFRLLKWTNYASHDATSKAGQGQSSYQCNCRSLVRCQSIHNSWDDEITHTQTQKYSETRRGSNIVNYISEE